MEDTCKSLREAPNKSQGKRSYYFALCFIPLCFKTYFEEGYLFNRVRISRIYIVSCVEVSLVSTFYQSDSRASGGLLHSPLRGDQRHPLFGPRLDFPATV